MKVFVLLLIISFSGVSYTLGNTFTFTKNCSEAYQLAFELKFDEAHAKIKVEQSENPDNASVYYILNYIDFIKAFISEEDQHFNNLKKNTDYRLQQIEKVNTENAWRNLARGDMMMHLAVIKLKKKEYLSAGYYIRKSFKIIENNNAQFPDFTPNLKSLGFYHAVIGSVPENYKWLANLAGMSGTIRQGADELTEALYSCKKNEAYSFLLPELFLLKMFIATHFEKDNKVAKELINNFKSFKINHSPLLTFVIANAHIAADEFDEALVTLNNFTSAPKTYTLHYLKYMKGNLLINNLDSSASKYLMEYVTHYKGNSFIKSSWLKMAWMDLINGKTNEYQSKIANVIVKGNDFTDEDKQALKEAESGIQPNIHLLKSRLLFDGGNYNEALNALAGKPASEFTTLKEQIEFTYRLARIFDKKEQYEKAVKYYEKTFTNGKGQEWYYAANSALLIAYYYESKGNTESATLWFKNCLSLRNHEYQNSIDQKAEAGLNRLGSKKLK